ncbi:MAG: Phosphoglycolate phosphatase, archaeal type, partial [uncultured Blastococcus sp.]
ARPHPLHRPRRHDGRPPGLVLAHRRPRADRRPGDRAARAAPGGSGVGAGQRPDVRAGGRGRADLRRGRRHRRAGRHDLLGRRPRHPPAHRSAPGRARGAHRDAGHGRARGGGAADRRAPGPAGVARTVARHPLRRRPAARPRRPGRGGRLAGGEGRGLADPQGQRRDPGGVAVRSGRGPAAAAGLPPHAAGNLQGRGHRVGPRAPRPLPHRRRGDRRQRQRPRHGPGRRPAVDHRQRGLRRRHGRPDRRRPQRGGHRGGHGRRLGPRGARQPL